MHLRSHEAHPVLVGWVEVVDAMGAAKHFDIGVGEVAIEETSESIEQIATADDQLFNDVFETSLLEHLACHFETFVESRQIKEGLAELGIAFL